MRTFYLKVKSAINGEFYLLLMEKRGFWRKDRAALWSETYKSMRDVKNLIRIMKDPSSRDIYLKESELNSRMQFPSVRAKNNQTLMTGATMVNPTGFEYPWWDIKHISWPNIEVRDVQ